MPVAEIYERTIEREIIVPIVTCTPVDPFEIDDPCPHNAGGPHQFTLICNELVCPMCAKVAWQ